MPEFTILKHTNPKKYYKNILEIVRDFLASLEKKCYIHIVVKLTLMIDNQ